MASLSAGDKSFRLSPNSLAALKHYNSERDRVEALLKELEAEYHQKDKKCERNP